MLIGLVLYVAFTVLSAVVLGALLSGPSIIRQTREERLRVSDSPVVQEWER